MFLIVPFILSCRITQRLPHSVVTLLPQILPLSLVVFCLFLFCLFFFFFLSQLHAIAATQASQITSSMHQGPYIETARYNEPRPKGATVTLSIIPMFFTLSTFTSFSLPSLPCAFLGLLLYFYLFYLFFLFCFLFYLFLLKQVPSSCKFTAQLW